MINKLCARIKETKAPIVVGLDPMMKFIPDYLKEAALGIYGETLTGAAGAVLEFNKQIIDEITPIITNHAKALNVLLNAK